MAHNCLACGRQITWRFAICVSCEQTYGARPGDWVKNGAPWLRYMWNNVQQQRRAYKRSKRTEATANIDEMRLPAVDGFDSSILD